MDPDQVQDDRRPIERTFTAELTPGDGRTADVRIIRYDEVATVADRWAPDRPYQEAWAPGVFDHQVKAAHRVLANVEHEKGVRGLVAKGLTLRSTPDSFYGSFRFMDNDAGNTALELVRDGVFDGVSLEAMPARTTKTASGIMRRTKAHLLGIAFCRFPAFAGSGVLSLRDGEPVDKHDIVLDEELLLPAPDPEVLARAKALGIEVPAGLLAADDKA